jgi:hypothetical protein
MIMQLENVDAPSTAGTASKGARVAGWIVGGLPALLLLFGSGLNLVKPESVVKATTEMGLSESAIRPIGAVLAVSTILYLIPATAVLGAILLTGYLGGAVATHVHIWQGWTPLFFPLLFGVPLWLGLVLRDRRLRSVLPIRS